MSSSSPSPPSPTSTPSPSSTPSPTWIPFSTSHVRGGTLAVSISALVSVLCVLTLALYSLVLLRRHRKRTPQERLQMDANGGGRAIKFLTSGHGVLLGSLLLGDLIESSGFMLSFGWIARGGLPSSSTRNPYCTAQGVIIQLGDLGSAFSSLVICVNLFLILVFQIHTSKKVLLGVLGVQWTIIAIMTLIGPVALERDGMPFFASTGGWCWIGGSYQSERLTLRYLWVFIVALTGIVLYAIMACKIWRQRRAVGNEALSGTAGVAKVMMLYPSVYVACILPLACHRIAAMTGRRWSTNSLLAAGTIFTLSGTANCLVYAFTRRIVSLHSVSGAFRSRSGGMLSAGGRGAACDTGRLSGIHPHISVLSRSRSGNTHDSHPHNPTSFALTGIRVDVETDVQSPELAYVYTPSLSSSGDGSDRTGKAYRGALLGGGPGARRVSEAGVPVEERPFNMLRGRNEGEGEAEEEEGAKAELELEGETSADSLTGSTEGEGVGRRAGRRHPGGLV
ncbi:hypothetical protein JCM11251_003820 [Rhodosporidiobolus azoricus]